MSYIDNLINDVEKTHQNFGKLIAFLQVATKARKFVLLVSPSGCGKSRAMSYIGQKTPDSYSPLNLSVASLGTKVDKLTSFRSTIIIDDIAAIQTDYGRKTTISTLAHLIYNHRVEPSMAGFDFAVEDFYGSAIIGIQPLMLRDLVLSPEWDTNIRDKTIRYYHTYRPLNPVLDFPVAQYESGLSIDSINEYVPDTKSEVWRKLERIGHSQWGRARTKEHLIDLLKSIASLENRKKVIDDDLLVLLDLIQILTLEKVIIVKEQLEGESYLDNILLALLVEYYTYNGEFSLSHIETDFQIHLAYAYRIMSSQNGNWQQIGKSPTIYKPSKKLERLLKENNLEIKK